jgi:hypothetical protein
LKLLNLTRAQRLATHEGSGFDDFCFELDEGEPLPLIDLQISNAQTPAEFMQMHANVHPYFLACFVLAAGFDPAILGLLVDREKDLGPWIISTAQKQAEIDKATVRRMPYMPGVIRSRSLDKYIAAATAAMVRAKAHDLLREFDDEA